MDNPTVLRDWLFLDAHPFTPTVDARRNFDFEGSNVPLIGPLELFRCDQLVAYYLQIGEFGRAVQQANQLIDRIGFPGVGRTPPTTLVHGPPGGGRTSLAHYVAYLIKRRWRERFPARPQPSFKSIRIESDNIARLMLTIKNHLKVHTTAHNISGAAEIFATFADDGGAANPQESVLGSLFHDLAEVMRGTPPLVLVAEPITLERRDWVARLGRQLTPLTVAPIFITSSDDVFDIVTRRFPNVSGLRLRQLTIDDGRQFVAARLGLFRADTCPATRGGIFPFASETLEQMFAGNAGLPVKILLEVLHGGFDSKLRELEAKRASAAGPGPADASQPPDEELLVRWEHIDQAYRDVLRRAAQPD